MHARLAVVVTSLLLLSAPPEAGAERTSRHVLLLNSYHVGYRWTDALTEAVRAALAERSDLVLHVEYMDAKRWPEARGSEALSDLLAAKYGPARAHRPDVVICADDHALDFVLAHRDEWLPGVPLLFAGINDFQPSRVVGVQRIGGVVEDYDFKGTFETILGLHPETQRFVLVGDETLSGRAAMNRARRAGASLGGRAPLVELVGKTRAELTDALRQLEPGDIAMYVSFLIARDGERLTLEESRRLVAEASPVPVYCFWDFFAGTGLLGGHGLSAENQGAAVARLALGVLDDGSASSPPIIHLEPNPYIFDWEQMQRFGIEREALPAGSVIVNHTPGFYARNWAWIWGIALFLLLEVLLLTGWLRASRRRKRLEEALVHSQKLEAIGRLAGGVAHDFRNQLTVIDGFSSLALRGLPEGSPPHDRLLKVRAATHKATLLTGQLLSFSRKQVLVPRVVDVHRLLSDQTESVSRIIGDDIELRFEAQPSLPPVRLDPHQLEQAVLNLAANARDAMPSGGTLTLSVCVVTLVAGDRPTELPPGDYVRLRVQDTGTGMARRVRDRVFEPFFTTKAVGRGTGLGLSMVYGFVGQSDGAVRVKSRPGEGTVVTIWLPAADPSAPRWADEPTPAPEGASRTPPGGTVLVVEDNPGVLELILDTFEREGVTAAGTQDPTRAMELAEGIGDELVLLIADVVMPDLYGPEVAARLHTRFPDLPVLYISGHTRAAFERLEAVPSDVQLLQKPFTPESLMERVRALLEP